MPGTKLFLVVLLVLLSSHLFADQLTLKNGDRLSGSIVSSDGKTVVIKTDFEGEVTVKWDAVESISSAQDLHVGLKDGKTVIGPVTTADGRIAVATKTAGTVEVQKESVVAMRNDAEQKAFELSQHPGLLQGWNGGANIGFALTRGNSETKNLALAFTATRTGLRDKLGLYANTIYATNDAPAALPSTTANTVQGGARYDHDLTQRVFGFVNADFMTDALQTLDLRSVFGGGIGLHVIKKDSTTLDFLGGLNYTHEKYSLFSRNFAAVQIGEEFMHKIRASTVMTQKLYFFPNLTDTGEYRGTFDFGTVTKINKWFGWQNTFADVYVTNPPAGKKKNDIILSTGLNVSFTH